MPNTRTAVGPGDRFGRLVVLARADDYVSPAGYRKSTWRVRCDCGTETTALGSHLTAGNVRSCGCLVVEHARSKLRDITGERFGPLVAVEYVGQRTTPNGWRSTLWRFVCDCGRTVDAQPSNLRRTVRQTCRHG